MVINEEFMRRMRELQEAREAASIPLGEILSTRRALQEQLAATEETYRSAYSTALAAGWTAEELTNLGADEPAPAKRSVGRPRKNAAKRVAASARNGSAVAASSSSSAVPLQHSTAALDAPAVEAVPDI